jgi:hypothetical protein
MSEADHGETSAALIAALRWQGADRIDPVRFRYIEALASRTLAHQGEVRRILDNKLVQALTAYGDRLEKMQGNVIGPENIDRSTPLTDLVRQLAQHASESVGDKSDGNIGGHPELRAIRDFRSTWSTLSVNRQVAQAIKQGPENAGPLNSHFLVLRSLELMREISPDYLNRFMSYVDTLLWLDQADKKNKPAAKKPATTKNKKKITLDNRKIQT